MAQGSEHSAGSIGDEDSDYSIELPDRILYRDAYPNVDFVNADKPEQAKERGDQRVIPQQTAQEREVHALCDNLGYGIITSPPPSHWTVLLNPAEIQYLQGRRKSDLTAAEKIQMVLALDRSVSMGSDTRVVFEGSPSAVMQWLQKAPQATEWSGDTQNEDGSRTFLLNQNDPGCRWERHEFQADEPMIDVKFQKESDTEVAVILGGLLMTSAHENDTSVEIRSADGRLKGEGRATNRYVSHIDIQCNEAVIAGDHIVIHSTKTKTVGREPKTNDFVLELIL